MEAVKVRDWLGELEGAGGAEDIGKFRGIVGEMAEVEPGLAAQACEIAGIFFDKGEVWAAEICAKVIAKAKEAAQKAEAAPPFCDPIQSTVEVRKEVKVEAAKAKPVEVEVGAVKRPVEFARRRDVEEVWKKAGAEPAKVKITVPTKAEALALLKELAEIFRSDKSEERLRYNTRKAEIAETLGCSQMDVHRATMKIVEDEEKKAKRSELTQAQKAVALSLVDGVKLWTDPMDGAAYVTVRVGGHLENYRVGDGAFEAWVRAEYGRRHWIEVEEQRVPAVISSTSLHEGIATMKAMALARGEELAPALRVGGGGGEVWLDLGGRDWALVKVTAGGWQEVRTGSTRIAFVRKPGMLPLPLPVRGGNIRELRRFLNVRDEDFVLEVGWLLGALRPAGPYPVMMITGIAGMGKTTACKVSQRMVDPNFADLRPFKKDDDMCVGAFNSHVLGFDNISRIRPDEADVLCRISTGIGYAKRALRTDAEQFMMRVSRPIILNGIPEDLAERSDLADRSIVLELPTIQDGAQQFEEEFWDEFEEARPRILGALLDGVVGALGSKVSLEGMGRVRMADFARWAEAGCQALGFEEGEFLNAFVLNQERAMRIAFKQDLVARAVALLIEQNPGGWRGNTQPLLLALEKAARKGKQGDMLDQKGWPQNDTWLGRNLRKSATVLRKACGIEIEFDLDLRKTGEGHDGGVAIRRRD